MKVDKIEVSFMEEVRKIDISEAEEMMIHRLLVQMSDGYFENDDYYNKYWMNLHVERETLYVYRRNSRFAPYNNVDNPLYDKPTSEIFKFFAETIYDDAEFAEWYLNSFGEECGISSEFAKKIVSIWESGMSDLSTTALQESREILNQTAQEDYEKLKDELEFYRWYLWNEGFMYDAINKHNAWIKNKETGARIDNGN